MSAFHCFMKSLQHFSCSYYQILNTRNWFFLHLNITFAASIFVNDELDEETDFHTFYCSDHFIYGDFFDLLGEHCTSLHRAQLWT